MARSEQPTSAMSAGEPHERFRQAVRLHAAALFRFCYSRLGDRQLAEDAVQETFLRAYRAAAEDRVETLSGWLFGTARRCCMELSRKRRRLSTKDDDLVPDVAAEPAGPGDGTAEEIEEALHDLSDGEQAMIHLRHVEGLKCREIAATLGKPLGTVTGTLSRAYEKLRRALRPDKE